MRSRYRVTDAKTRSPARWECTRIIDKVARGLSPQALSEPDVSLSAHPAPIIQQPERLCLGQRLLPCGCPCRNTG